MSEAKKSFGELWKDCGSTLRGNWGKSVLLAMILIVLAVAGEKLDDGKGIIEILLIPLDFGFMRFFLRLAKRENVTFGTVFEPFGQYFHYLWGGIRVSVFVFLWSLLLIVPGMIAAYRYAMTPYIMLEQPELSAKEAMKQSCVLMYGHKGRLFGYSLLLGLIGMPVCILTLGLGALWFIPWAGAFLAHFYLDLRPDAESAEEAGAHDA